MLSYCLPCGTLITYKCWAIRASVFMMQYILFSLLYKPYEAAVVFLKVMSNFCICQGVGLKLDDALAFWRAEFSQKVYTAFGHY